MRKDLQTRLRVVATALSLIKLADPAPTNEELNLQNKATQSKAQLEAFVNQMRNLIPKLEGAADIAAAIKIVQQALAVNNLSRRQ